MSWMQNRAPIALALALTAGAAGGALWTTSAAAATIVVRSNGPSAGIYPVGKSLPSGLSVVLKAGDVITVLDAGGTRVLRGPGKVSVSSMGPATVNGIAALIADTGARQSRTGATRGAYAAAPHPTNVWSIDVTRGGNFCVGNAKALALWRPQSDTAASVTIVPGGGTGVPVPFRPGQAVVAWPAALPVSEGSQFRIAGLSPRQPAVTITLRLLPNSPASLDSTAQALLEHGCTAQVDTLVAATTTDAGS